MHSSFKHNTSVQNEERGVDKRNWIYQLHQNSKGNCIKLSAVQLWEKDQEKLKRYNMRLDLWIGQSD